MKWNDQHGRDPRVKDKTGWIFIGNERDHIQDRAGVYILANAGLQVKYIGKAGPSRALEELEDAIYRRGKDYLATKLLVLYTNSNANALSLESDLIEYYQPQNNIRK